MLFLLSGGPDRVLAGSQVEEALWVQAGAEEEAAPSDGLLSEPPPLGPPDSQEDPFGPNPGRPGTLSLGSIPVAFGENAPLDVPERAGKPRAFASGDSAHRRVEAFDRPPGQLQTPRPGATGVGGQPVPGKAGSPVPGQALQPNAVGGATPQPRTTDSYRRALLVIYHLEQKGGDLALTPAQARHLLDLVTGMEGLKGAVPEARSVFLEVLTPEQIDLVQARRVARGTRSLPSRPEELDKEARNALEKLGK